MHLPSKDSVIAFFARQQAAAADGCYWSYAALKPVSAGEMLQEAADGPDVRFCTSVRLESELESRPIISTQILKIFPNPLKRLSYSVLSNISLCLVILEISAGSGTRLPENPTRPATILGYPQYPKPDFFGSSITRPDPTCKSITRGYPKSGQI